MEGIAELRAEFSRRPGLIGPGRRAAFTTLTDDWLAGLFRAAAGQRAEGMALVAVGGHGRGELSARSDLDLLLLHRPDHPEAAEVAERIWYPIWDAGLRLDHSVRTPAHARRTATEDVRAVLGMLDARAIAGDEPLVATMRSAVLADWRATARDRLPALRELVERRRDQFGDAAHLLEPEIKESYGGLRDATVLRALTASWIADAPHGDLESRRSLLLDVRDALHAQGAQDRLLMQEQPAVAALLGYRDEDELLRAVSSAARGIAHASDLTWHRVDRLLRPRGLRRLVRRSGAERVPLADGVVLQEGEVVLAAAADPAADPGLVLRAAAAAAQSGMLLAEHAVNRLAQAWREPAGAWPSSMREDLVSLLGAGPATVPVWEALDQAGLMERLLPHWAAVRSAPQRNPVHRFTVDRHLVETAVQASALTTEVDRPDLLLAAALLHDIGKGRGGDHSIVGAALAEEICPHLGFDAEDSRVIVTLVRHHLLLVDTATRRDLEDPATIAEVADAIPDVMTLHLLAALTRADALATGPGVWNEWRARLVDDLADRVRASLAGSQPPAEPLLGPDEEEALAALADDGVHVLMHPVEGQFQVTVAAPDRPGLLASVAGVLALHRLEVRAAKVATLGSRAVQVWTVRPLFGDPPSAQIIGDDLRRAAAGALDVTAVLAERARTARGRPTAPPRVLLIAGERSTTLEVHAHDAPGLLHRLTAAVTGAGADVRGAKVATLGSEAVDVFFLEGPEGGPLPELLAERVQAEVLAAAGAGARQVP